MFHQAIRFLLFFCMSVGPLRVDSLGEFLFICYLFITSELESQLCKPRKLFLPWKWYDSLASSISPTIPQLQFRLFLRWCMRMIAAALEVINTNFIAQSFSKEAAIRFRNEALMHTNFWILCSQLWPGLVMWGSLAIFRLDLSVCSTTWCS